MNFSLRQVLRDVLRSLGRYTGTIALVALVIYVASGFYKVGRSEVAVVTRFGRVVAGRVPPGLHYALPYPIEVVHKVPVRQVHTVELLDFSTKYVSGRGRGASFNGVTGLEPYAITGDDNLVALGVSLKYVISDPVKYLFVFRTSETTVETVASRVLTRLVAGRAIDPLLTGDRSGFRRMLRAQLQKEFDSLEMGIVVSLVDITELAPPPAVQPFFEKVVNAKSDAMRLLNEARGYEGKKLAEARARANRMVQEAEAYRRNRVLEAEGWVDRFTSRLAEYSRSPDLVMFKMRTEYWRTIFSTLGELRTIRPSRGPQKFYLEMGR